MIPIIKQGEQPPEGCAEWWEPDADRDSFCPMLVKRRPGLRRYNLYHDGSGLILNAFEEKYLHIPTSGEFEDTSGERIWAATPEAAIEEHCKTLPFGRVSVRRSKPHRNEIGLIVHGLAWNGELITIIGAENCVLMGTFVAPQLTQLIAILRHVQDYLRDGGGVIKQLLEAGNVQA